MLQFMCLPAKRIMERTSCVNGGKGGKKRKGKWNMFRQFLDKGPALFSAVAAADLK